MNIGPSTLEFELRVNDLRKCFAAPNGERIEVLRGVSFEAQPGETIAITGASGAGKSTLLHLLGGLESPVHGSIRLGTFQIDKSQPSELSRLRQQHVGLVFQFHYLLADFSAAENVALPLLIRRTRYEDAVHQAHAALAEVGLQDRCDHRVGDLSGGEQQRVAICRALITQPALVLADEPTGNVDTATGEDLSKLFISYAQRRPAIVIVATHNRILAEVCDQILKIDEGRLQVVRRLETTLK